MEPLDLRKTPPRKPTEVLGGVMFMARTIDKLRATLPGGNVGAYAIAGFSAQLLERLGLAEDDLRAVVALAANDEEIDAWVLRHTSREQRDAVNAWLPSETIADAVARRPTYYERYPVARELPPETPLIEVLTYDDIASFAEG